MISNNTIIPSIRKYKYFEKALSCQSEYVLLSEANIGNLQSLIGKCHQSGKKVLVHLELLGGFKPDQAGINLLKNYYKVDGVISSNLSALRYAKKEGLLTVYRVLLIDSRSLISRSILLNTVHRTQLKSYLLNMPASVWS